ncbi:MAG: hypothetical protein JWR64_2652 [Marmoricola sp.]|nr:hypothetical protein [Marmoricola sp.]MCW2822857.1 hypothetical protein [Marmoricola sp.]
MGPDQPGGAADLGAQRVGRAGVEVEDDAVTALGLQDDSTVPATAIAVASYMRATAAGTMAGAFVNLGLVMTDTRERMSA